MTELRDTRLALGLTQAELGQLLGVHALTVYRWESGKLKAPPYHATLINAFGQAEKQAPGIGRIAVNRMAECGTPFAVWVLLKAAYKDKMP